MDLEEYPITVKEVKCDKYHIKIEQHYNLYVLEHNGKKLAPVNTLTLALYFFDKLVDKENKIYNH